MTYDQAMFPFEYPFLNHPSTILLIKAPFGVKEVDQVPSSRIIKMNERYHFLPSFTFTFVQEKPGVVSCKFDLPLIEM